MRVLILKLAAIGDVVMALPMVTAAKALSEDVHITWVCGRTVAPLLRRVPAINRLIVVDEQSLFRGGKTAKVAAVFAAWRQLYFAHYNLVILGNADWRYRLLLKPVRADVFRSFRRDGRPHPLPGRHHSDEYVRLITDVDGPFAPRFDLPTFQMPDVANVRRQLEAVGEGPVVAVAPGGARNVMGEQLWRRWPTKHYAALVELLIKRGFRVIVVGGPTDADVTPSLADLNVLNLIGKTDLPDLVGVLSLADVIVSHDTSIIHLARLSNRPVLGLFGPTTPFEKLFPSNDSMFIWGGERLPCRPCYDGVNFHPCPDNQCMKSIEITDVFAAITKILAAKQTVGDPLTPYPALFCAP